MPKDLDEISEEVNEEIKEEKKIGAWDKKYILNNREEFPPELEHFLGSCTKQRL